MGILYVCECTAAVVVTVLLLKPLYHRRRAGNGKICPKTGSVLFGVICMRSSQGYIKGCSYAYTHAEVQQFVSRYCQCVVSGAFMLAQLHVSYIGQLVICLSFHC